MPRPRPAERQKSRSWQQRPKDGRDRCKARRAQRRHKMEEKLGRQGSISPYQERAPPPSCAKRQPQPQCSQGSISPSQLDRSATQPAVEFEHEEGRSRCADNPSERGHTMCDAQGELRSAGVVTRQGSRLSGAVQRWAQNQWKESWLAVDKSTMRVYRREEDFTSGNVRPRIAMDILTCVLLGCGVTPLNAARQRLSFALGLRSGFPGQIADMDVLHKVGLLVQGGSFLSRQRFTVDDGTMLVHFRCSTPSARDSWIQALCAEYGVQKYRTMQTMTLEVSKDSGSVATAVDCPIARRRRERSARLKNVGDYMLGELVGEGGYLRIKSGFSSVSGERVAVRIIYGRCDGPLQCMKKDILAMRALKHPNIVELKDVIGAGGDAYLIMELAGGGELFAKLCEVGKFAEHEARFYWQQLLTGMMYCHTKGVYHSDLRFENLLLDSTGSVLKITGFFDLDHSSSKAVPKRLDGTVVYNAPEDLLLPYSLGYERNYFAADVWRCGVILYAMIVGNFPFVLNQNQPRSIREHLTKAVRLPGGASLELRDMFSKVFDPDPKRRATVQDLLRHPWTVGSGNPAYFDRLIEQMDARLVDDADVARKLDEIDLARPDLFLDLESLGLDVDLDVDVDPLDQDRLMDQLVP